jgi:hypothetical protein
MAEERGGFTEAPRAVFPNFLLTDTFDYEK